MPEIAMTEAEVASWLLMLGKSNTRRISVIEDLLRHANGDQMSPEDKAICRSQLAKLRLLPPDPDDPPVKRPIVCESDEENDEENEAP